MKNHLSTILIALFLGFIGGIASHSLYSPPADTSKLSTDQYIDGSNPFATAESTTSNYDELVYQMESLHLKINILQSQLEEFKKETGSEQQAQSQQAKTVTRNRPVTPKKQYLIAAGISAEQADNILRKLSEQEFRRLELQNLIRRNASPENAKAYRNELRELNKNRISIRDELGDEAYDSYLYESGQNNRVKVSSIMAGSPAESSGLQSGDIILYYDDKKILNWADIRKVTLQGDISGFVNIELLRDGERINLVVQRGTLGVKLDPVQIEP